MTDQDIADSRTTTLRLTSDGEGGYGYAIDVDGVNGCIGSGMRRPIDAYAAAVEQLSLNDDSFPLDIPNPFATESARESTFDRLVQAGLRDDPAC